MSAATEAPKVTSGGGLFTRGSKYRFSGRCQKEVFSESANIQREPPQFVRSSSNPQFVRSFNNKLKSNSMPRVKQDRGLHNMEDVVVESNHLSMSALPLLENSLQDKLDESIPEEPAVEVSDQPYAPMIDSPSKEELPPLPVENQESSTDLDAQIQELQNELDRCKVESNHLNAAYPGDGVLNNSTPTTPTGDKSAMPSTPQPASAKPKRSKLKLCCALTVAMISFAVIVGLILGVLILETDLELPVVNDLRELPEVQDFKRLRYQPARDGVVNKVGGWFE